MFGKLSVADRSAYQFAVYLLDYLNKIQSASELSKFILENREILTYVHDLILQTIPNQPPILLPPPCLTNLNNYFAEDVVDDVNGPAKRAVFSANLYVRPEREQRKRRSDSPPPQHRNEKQMRYDEQREEIGKLFASWDTTSQGPSDPINPDEVPSVPMEEEPSVPTVKEPSLSTAGNPSQSTADVNEPSKEPSENDEPDEPFYDLMEEVADYFNLPLAARDISEAFLRVYQTSDSNARQNMIRWSCHHMNVNRNDVDSNNSPEYFLQQSLRDLMLRFDTISQDERVEIMALLERFVPVEQIFVSFLEMIMEVDDEIN